MKKYRTLSARCHSLAPQAELVEAVNALVSSFNDIVFKNSVPPIEARVKNISLVAPKPPSSFAANLLQKLQLNSFLEQEASTERTTPTSLEFRTRLLHFLTLLAMGNKFMVYEKFDVYIQKKLRE